MPSTACLNSTKIYSLSPEVLLLNTKLENTNQFQELLYMYIHVHKWVFVELLIVILKVGFTKSDFPTGTLSKWGWKPHTVAVHTPPKDLCEPCLEISPFVWLLTSVVSCKVTFSERVFGSREHGLNVNSITEFSFLPMCSLPLMKPEVTVKY